MFQKEKIIKRHGLIQTCSLNAKLYIKLKTKKVAKFGPFWSIIVVKTKNNYSYSVESIVLTFTKENIELVLLQKQIAYLKIYSMCFRSFLVILSIRSVS